MLTGCARKSLALAGRSSSRRASSLATGRRSRDNGASTERGIVRLLQAHGLSARHLRVTVNDVERAVEVKCRAVGFRQLYEWLNQSGVLIVTADRQEPLIVSRMSLAAGIAEGGDARRKFPTKGNEGRAVA
jgi:hypothetical protein